MITVITAITDNCDELRDDFPKSDAKYVAFLDDDSMVEGVGNSLWKIRDCCSDFEESRRNAKIHKIMPHKYVDTDISIWLDANISLNVTPEELAEVWLKDKDIAVCKHFERDCIYVEADVCKMYQLDNPDLIDRQIDKYRKMGYPKHAGLSECGVIIRRHTPEINRLSELWWEEIVKGSSRDQLSFNYIFRDIENMDANARFNPLFNYSLHLKKSNNDYAKYYI